MDLAPNQSLNLTTGALAERVLTPGTLVYSRTDVTPVQVWTGVNASDPGRIGIAEKGKYLGKFKAFVRNSAGQAYLAQLDYSVPRYVPLTSIAVPIAAANALPASERDQLLAAVRLMNMDEANFKTLNVNRYLLDQLKTVLPATTWQTLADRNTALAERYNARQNQLRSQSAWSQAKEVVSGWWNAFKDLVGISGPGIGFIPLIAALGWGGTLAVGAITAAGVIYLGTLFYNSLFGQAQGDNVQAMEDYRYLVNALPPEGQEKLKTVIQQAEERGASGGFFGGASSLVKWGVIGLLIWKGLPIVQDALKSRGGAK